MNRSRQLRGSAVSEALRYCRRVFASRRVIAISRASSSFVLRLVPQLEASAEQVGGLGFYARGLVAFVLWATLCDKRGNIPMGLGGVGGTKEDRREWDWIFLLVKRVDLYVGLEDGLGFKTFVFGIFEG